MDAHARMLHAADTARTERDYVADQIVQHPAHALTFQVADMTPRELATYYHGKQDAFEHAAQMTRQDAQ